MPRVSVVIPLYQTEAYIAAAIDSVLAQTFADFEVVVIDDGSRDRGPDIVRAYDDPRVRLVVQENRGLAGARNSGIRESRCDLVALLDADDLWHPEKLARHVAHLDLHPEVDVSFCASRLIDENGQDVGLVQRPGSDCPQPGDFFSRNPVGNGSVPVIRRAALARIGFQDVERGRICWFDESFRQSEDIECWMRMVVQGGLRFGYVDEPLTLYRVNSGGLSANIEAQLATWHRFRDKVASYAPDLVAAHGSRAEAYQLRYLARRAVRSDDPAAALPIVLRALRTYPRMLVEEPTRTLTTLAAAVAKRVLPASIFGAMEQRALGAAAIKPGLRL